MINKNLMDELNRLGFGADVDALETYVLNLQDAAAAGTPEVTDTMYDMYYNLLKQLKPNSVAFMRNWESDDYELDPCDRLLERYKMKSIITVKSMEDLVDFRSRLGDTQVSLHVSVKINGYAIRAVYRYGRLIAGTTRGRYKKGRNILRHLREILPNTVNEWQDIRLVEVRGELTIKKDTFESIKDYLKTPLSCITHILRDSATLSEIKLLDCLCYKYIPEDDARRLDSLHQEYEYLQSCGFKVPIYMVFDGIDYYNFDVKIEEMLNYFEGMYENGDIQYDCDGIVVAVDDNSIFDSFGESDNYNLANFALKMGRIWESNIYKSVIEKIEWDTSKEYMIPIAKIKPVITITGEEINTVPLHNIGVLEKINLFPGSQIYFKFGGKERVALCDANGTLITGII